MPSQRLSPCALYLGPSLLPIVARNAILIPDHQAVVDRQFAIELLRAFMRAP